MANVSCSGGGAAGAALLERRTWSETAPPAASGIAADRHLCAENVNAALAGPGAVFAGETCIVPLPGHRRRTPDGWANDVMR